MRSHAHTSVGSGGSSGRRHRWRAVAAAAVLAAGVVALAPAGPAGASPRSYTVVASGLDNPRHLAIGRFGGVYVAESGRGGDTCTTGVDPDTGEPTEVCAGPTGAITRISGGGVVHEVLTGLPSQAGPDGAEALGPVDVSVAEGLHVLISGPTAAQPPPLAGVLEGAGTLVRRVEGTDSVRTVADIAAYEAASNPDGGVVDSNPYGLYTSRAGDHWVTDAGGNSLLAVTKAGAVSTVATFAGGEAPAPPFLGAPPGTLIPYEAVPTSVDAGPDGRPYVGQLTGFPFPRDKAKVFRVGRYGAVAGHAFGFTNVVDIDFGPDGSLYVVELAAAGLLAAGDGPPVGALYRIHPDGSRELLSGPELVLPGGVVVAGNGAVYVSTNSTSAGAGQVLRYAP
jgi:hypothetical protein